MHHIPPNTRFSSFKSKSLSLTELIKTSECGIVALKRIYATSSPTRIWNEIAILHLLKYGYFLG